MPIRFSRTTRAIFAVLVVLWFVHRSLTEIAIDWMWFESAGYLGIFETSIKTRIALFCSGAAIAATFVGLNLRHAFRVAPVDPVSLSLVSGEMVIEPGRLKSLLKVLGALLTLLPAFIFGLVASSVWFEVLSFMERQPFGTTEGVFGYDVGFYIFELPLLAFARNVAVGLTVVTSFGCGVYYLFQHSAMGRGPMPISDAGRKHLLALVGLLFLLAAGGWWLDRFELLFQREGVVWGVGYTDEHARIPAFGAMTVIALAVSFAMFSSVRLGGLRRPITALGGYIIARMLIAGAWPSVVQQYSVKPNELGFETEYLERNIEATRSAFGLERIEVKPFDAASDLTMADLEANPQTIENIRVWDDRPLLTTLRQMQEIRLYYDFADVDVDRYMINGQSRQVMLSARELNYASVPASAQSWFNEHLQYTHGYGLTMSPVNVVTPEGLPALFIQDIPPKSNVDIEITRPEIYYGELTDRFILVDTKAEEFDYSDGDQNAYTRYAGTGGVPIGTTFRKALFSLYYQSFDILLSNYLTEDSRILFRRQIKDRLQNLAPFLHYDRDPYLVVVDGRMVWMMDAYTVSDRYPYAEQIRTSRQNINYMRNSVKVVIDAYNGSVDFYIADAEDPLIQVYAKVFPNVFKPVSEMPESLVPHIRYPADFFDIQAAMYRAYHMTDPTVFYNKEDMWEAPKELFGDKEQLMQSYYLIMKLPGESEEEFILLVPFVPTNKDNMISWMAARCDPENYGRLVLYQFPKQKLIYGPSQIEARIDQTPEISEQITLWSQAGSRVIRGNLLVIPVEDSLMYVEAVYLQAESSQLPELKRVIVSYENAIAMEETLDKALRKVFGSNLDVIVSDEVAQDGTVAQNVSLNWRSLVGDAQILYEQAVTAQKEGDWAAYGVQLGQLEQTLKRLSSVAEAPETTAATEAGE
ncbi:MAG: hypothetical protein CL930_11920 [Deltaproteobacteria bacterium]|nr:hypothetical protein [Deltaproteobacteria bacterium]